MTTQEAKEILAHYRPNTSDVTEPEFAEALKFARTSPELSQWLSDQQQFHSLAQQQLRGIEVPADLKARILDQKPGPEPVIRPIWRRREFLPLAASVAILLGAAAFWLSRPNEELSFENFRSRMVSFALRTYQMDILTNDPAAVRQYLRSHGAPADFEVTPPLARMPVKGGGKLSWQNRPVSMICFSLPDNETLYMFVIEGTRLPNSKPPLTPSLGQQKRLATLEWMADGKAYLVTASTDPKTLAALAPSAN
jgi:hypothetical protein